MEINSLKVLSTSLAGRYAIALFNEGKKTNCLKKIVENFKSMFDFFDKNPSLKKLLTSNFLSDKDISTGWISLGESLSFCPVFVSFMRHLVKHKRFDIVKMVRYIFSVALSKYKNKRTLTIYSAVDLLPEQKEEIECAVKKAFKEKLTISYKIDEKILAGIKIHSEELIIDASARMQIKQISDFMRKIKIKGEQNEN